MYFLGYPLPTIILALAGLFVCYLILEICSFSVAYRYSSPGYKDELRKIWWIIFFMPLYRYLVYWFRLAGIIIALTEPGSWKVDNPVKQIMTAVTQDWSHLKNITNKKRR